MKSLTTGLVMEKPTLGTPEPLKVRDFVKLHPEAAAGFFDEEATFFIVAEVKPSLRVVSSTGTVFYPYRWEVILEKPVGSEEEDGRNS